MSFSDIPINEQLQTLCRQGAKLINLGDYDRAISKYYEALTILPAPIRKGPAATFLNAAIGEAYWKMKDYDRAGEAFGDAFECADGDHNPNIVFRIGQCLVECGHADLSKEYFEMAVRFGGEHLFDEADIKYYYVLHPEAIPQPEPEPEPEPVYQPAYGQAESSPMYFSASSYSADAEEIDYRPTEHEYSASDPNRFDAGLEPRRHREEHRGASLFNRASIVTIDEDDPISSVAKVTGSASAPQEPEETPQQEPEKLNFFQRLFKRKKK